jgi:uncharacterized membrane protein YphA (DoxX/SURF4 family)
VAREPAGHRGRPTVVTTTPLAARWTAARPWASTVARLVLGAVWIAAGATKVTDLAASVRAVRAYRLLPEGVVPAVGAGLPLVEIVLGVLLLAGLGTRLAAAVSAVLLLGFVVGIASAWTRGLRIDCGCFGGGGTLAEGRATAYVPELARDVGLLLAAGVLLWWPHSRWSVDTLLFGTPEET